jgi:hypothetical protein
MWDPNLPGGGPEATPRQTPEEVAAAAALAKAEADRSRRQQEQEAAAARAQIAEETAARMASEQAAVDQAMREAYARGLPAFRHPTTGSAIMLPAGYQPSSGSALAGRIVPSTDTSAAARVAAYQPPAPKGEWTSTQRPGEFSGANYEEKFGGPRIPGEAERAIRAVDAALGSRTDLGESQAYPPPRPQPPKSSVRFAIGGQWYEQAPGGSSYTPVDQVKHPGAATEYVKTGEAVGPETLSAIRGGDQVKAFGKTIPAIAGGGGFSPSPSIADVAYVPQSIVDDMGERLKIAETQQAMEDLKPVGKLPAPGGTVQPYQQMILDIANSYGMNQKDARALAMMLAGHSATAQHGVSAKEMPADEKFARLQQINAAADRAKEQLLASNPNVKDPKVQADLDRIERTRRIASQVYMEQKPSLMDQMPATQ